jgi:hypothetical protein
MPFWCETREKPNQDPSVLKGMSWTEKAGPERSAVMWCHSFLEQGSSGGASGQALWVRQSLTAPAVTPAAT